MRRLAADSKYQMKQGYQSWILPAVARRALIELQEIAFATPTDEDELFYKSPPTLTEVNYNFMEKQDITIVAFFASEDSTAFKAYSQAAEILRE
ncbi:hypothetical protein OSTOST_09079, partial [Ostertagia ostertagi]